MHTIFYFGLPDQTNRYTSQLSGRWIPNAVKYLNNRRVKWKSVHGGDYVPDIVHGKVLDAHSRSMFSTDQVREFLGMINADMVKDGDAIYLQDMWTPGIEAIFYALSVRGIKVRLYAMCHAQSVDEFDFTYPMAYWMRHSETAISEWIKENGGALFVASSCHKELLVDKRINCRIHVVGLPFDYYDVEGMALQGSWENRRTKMVYASRLDKEKQPNFMLEVAREWLLSDQQHEFIVCSGADSIRSDVPRLEEYMTDLRNEYGGRFKIQLGLSKQEYYITLANSGFLLNTSLQDFVSWTLLEGVTFGVEPIFPDFRSFPECLEHKYLYPTYSGLYNGKPQYKDGRVSYDFTIQTEAPVSRAQIRREARDNGEEAPTSVALRCNAGRLLAVEQMIADVAEEKANSEVDSLDLWKIPMPQIDLINAGYRRYVRKIK